METTQLARSGLYSISGQQFRLIDWALVASRPSQVAFILVEPFGGGNQLWLNWVGVKDIILPASDTALEEQIKTKEAELAELKAKLAPKTLRAPKLNAEGTALVIEPVEGAEFYEVYVVVEDGKRPVLKGPIFTLKETKVDVADYAKEFQTFAVVANGGGLRSEPATITLKIDGTVDVPVELPVDQPPIKPQKGGTKSLRNRAK